MVSSPVSIFAEENETYNEKQVLRMPIRQFSKNYSHNGAKGRLEITYTINTSTGEIYQIVSAEMINLTPGKTIRLDHIEFSGNTVSVGIGYDGVSQIDSFNLY